MTTVQNSELHEVATRVADYPTGEAVAVSVLPTCDICVHVEHRKEPASAVVDGRTGFGQWANMCWPHYQEHGVGLGTGFGQRLVIPPL